jgi:hypothetical protein
MNNFLLEAFHAYAAIVPTEEPPDLHKACIALCRALARVCLFVPVSELGMAFVGKSSGGMTDGIHCAS